MKIELTEDQIKEIIQGLSVKPRVEEIEEITVMKKAEEELRRLRRMKEQAENSLKDATLSRQLLEDDYKELLGDLERNKLILEEYDKKYFPKDEYEKLMGNNSNCTKSASGPQSDLYANAIRKNLFSYIDLVLQGLIGTDIDQYNRCVECATSKGGKVNPKRLGLTFAEFRLIEVDARFLPLIVDQYKLKALQEKHAKLQAELEEYRNDYLNGNI